MNNITKYVINVLRRYAWARYPSRQEALVAARVARGRYECASCGELFGPRQIAVDHIQPVVDPDEGFTTLDNYVKRLLVPASKLQVLCTKCHSVKTVEENSRRAK